MKKSSTSIFFIVLAAVLFVACLAMLIYFRCPWWTLLAVAAYFAAMTFAMIKYIDKIWLSVACLVVLMALSMLLCSATRGLREVPFVDTLIENIFTGNTVESPSEVETPKKLTGARMSAPSGYTRTLVTLPDCALELVSPADGGSGKVIYQLHGGGYIERLGDFHRENALRLSAYGGGADVASLDYRTYPKAVHPAALTDAMAGYAALTDAYGAENIVIAGDSAGGGLALALTMLIVEQGLDKPAAVIAMCPWADMASGTLEPLYAGDGDLRDPYVSPAFGDYTGFPPLLIQVGDADVIYQDSLAVYNKAKADGAVVTLTEYEGMPHDFQLFLGDETPSGKEAWAEVESFISEHAPEK